MRFASSLPALLAGGDVDTRIDPVALHHYMTFHAVVPAPLTILRGVRKLPAGDRSSPSSPTAGAPTTTYWTPELHPATTTRADWSERDWQDAGAVSRCASRSSAGWSPTCRSACCCPAASTPA